MYFFIPPFKPCFYGEFSEKSHKTKDSYNAHAWEQSEMFILILQILLKLVCSLSGTQPTKVR